MASGVGKGRPRKAHPYFLCQRVEVLHRVFAWALSQEDWLRINRLMLKPYDEHEEASRRREYSEILTRLAISELIGRCDPDDETAYPARILKWQYVEGIIGGGATGASEAANKLFSGKKAAELIEKRSEIAKHLALYIVSDEADVSMERLQKLYRQGDRSLGAVELPADDIFRDR